MTNFTGSTSSYAVSQWEKKEQIYDENWENLRTKHKLNGSRIPEGGVDSTEYTLPDKLSQSGTLGTHWAHGAISHGSSPLLHETDAFEEKCIKSCCSRANDIFQQHPWLD